MQFANVRHSSLTLLPVSGVKGQTLKIFLLAGLGLPALELVCELLNGLLCLPASLPLLVTLFQDSLIEIKQGFKKKTVDKSVSNFH